MNLIKVTHPRLEGVHEVPESALGHWGRVGWEPAEAEQDAPAASQPPAPATGVGSQPEPSKTTRPRPRVSSKESE